MGSGSLQGPLRNRIIAACYRQMDLPDAVAEDDAYVALALRLGTDLVRRDQLRSRILSRKHRLYEDAEAVRELERFFFGAVDRWR